MKKLFTAALIACALSGCMNIWTRNPFTDTEITSVYQSSRTMTSGAIVVAFPQMMSDCPSEPAFILMNLFTIPLGGLVLCDAACEAALDTVFLPFDWPVSARRTANEQKGNR